MKRVPLKRYKDYITYTCPYCGSSCIHRSIYHYSKMVDEKEDVYFICVEMREGKHQHTCAGRLDDRYARNITKNIFIVRLYEPLERLAERLKNAEERK